MPRQLKRHLQRTSSLSLSIIKPSFDWHFFFVVRVLPRAKERHHYLARYQTGQARPGLKAMHARLQLRAKCTCTYPSAISPGAMLLYPPSTQGLADADRGARGAKGKEGILTVNNQHTFLHFGHPNNTNMVYGELSITCYCCIHTTTTTTYYYHHYYLSYAYVY